MITTPSVTPNAEAKASGDECFVAVKGDGKVYGVFTSLDSATEHLSALVVGDYAADFDGTVWKYGDFTIARCNFFPS